MIKIAKTAGFCFGVSRSLKIVEEILNSGEKVSTFGEIIHNSRVVEGLRRKGVTVCCGLEDVEKDRVLVLRSHGVGPGVYEYAEKNGIRLVDGSCPFVKKIHKIVKEADCCGKRVLLAGDEFHPEVLGIKEYFVKSKPYIFSSLCELCGIFERDVLLKEENLVVVAQTTFNEGIFRSCVNLIERECANVEVFNTICCATAKRQREAVNIAKEVDYMVVVGGKNSANTARLVELCEKFCETSHVESCSDLEDLKFERFPKEIGITAGASTPFDDVLEVYYLIKSEIFGKGNKGQ